MNKKIFLPLLFTSTILFAGCDTQTNNYSFDLDKSSITLSVDEDYTIGYTLENISSPIKWSSSDPSVVGVSGNVITARSEGEATITATVMGITKTCNVSVTPSVNGQYFVDSSKAINIEISSEGIIPEFKYYLIQDNKKNEITDASYSFEIKDKNIAKIVDGKIVPLNVGTTTIKVDYPKASSEFILNVCTKIISKDTQFMTMVNNRDEGSFFALANDIDFSGQVFEGYSKKNDISSPLACFKGTFEGNGYTIKGITLEGKSGNHSIFGSLYNAHIKDVNFEDIVLNNVQPAESMAVIANAMTGVDCEIKNVKISCNYIGKTTGNLNLIASKYLENSYTNVSSVNGEIISTQVSFGSSKISNVLIDAKFNGKTMKEANVSVVPADSYGFYPECNNVLIYAKGGFDKEIPGVKVFDNKLDMIWNVHCEKLLPDTNWDYSKAFELPSLLNASSSSGLVYSQSEMIDIDDNYEIITTNENGYESVVYPYGNYIEGFIYGDHPTKVSKQAIFVHQRWHSYSSQPTVPCADLQLDGYLKVCFFVRTHAFNQSFITIKDLITGGDYSTLNYDCEVSDKWVKVELVKKSADLWNVYIGSNKISHDYPASTFKEIPLNFNDKTYYYSEMLGVKDPNYIPKTWHSLGQFATGTQSTLQTTTNVICSKVPSVESTIVNGGGGDIAKLNKFDATLAKEYRFYVRAANTGDYYFQFSIDGSITIDGVLGKLSHKAVDQNWMYYKFIISDGNILFYRNDEFMSTIPGTDFSIFGIQVTPGAKFYVSEMFYYK